LLKARVRSINNFLEELIFVRKQIAMTIDDEHRERLDLSIRYLKDEIEKIVSELESKTGVARDQLLLQLDTHHNLSLKKEGVFDPEPPDLELEAAKLKDAA